MSCVSSSQQSFLVNALTSLNQKPKCRDRAVSSVKFISCGYPQKQDDYRESPRKNENKLAKLAIVALTAGVLTLGSVQNASAAKTGGRVGGQAFRSSGPRSSPRVNNNSRTNIYINPPVAPPLVGGYGVPFFGGWGWSPFSLFAPGPGVADGIGSGFDTLVLIMFLGAGAAVIRRFLGSRDEDNDDY